MTKILVLGGGPAGYVAAGRAAQLGAEVTVVEAREIGGTCLNRGCIPTKAMVAGAARLHEARGAGESTACRSATSVSTSPPSWRARTPSPCSCVTASPTCSRRARCRWWPGGLRSPAPAAWPSRPAPRLPDGTVLEEGGELEGDAVILASGSEPVRMGLFDWSDPRIMTSDELLRIDSVPATLAIVGGGVIGCEFASVFNRLGTEVTVVEMLDQLLPGEDQRVGRTLQQAFKKAGIAVHVKTAVEAAEAGGAGVTLRLAGGSEVTAERVLVAVGRRPLSAGLGYEEAGVEVGPGGFVVTRRELPHDPRRRVRGGRRGRPAAPRPLGLPPGRHRRRERGDRLAACSATARSSPTASSALRRSRAAVSPRTRRRPSGIAHEVAHVRFNGNSKAVCDGDADGFVRVVCEPGGGTRARRQPDRAARHRARARARAGGPPGPDAGRRRRDHPCPPDALRGGRGGRARRRGARRAQPLSG